MNTKEVIRRLEEWIRTVAKDKGVIIGLSGGIDSSVACILAKNALGAKKVKGIILTESKFSREVGLSIAETFAKDNNIEIEKIGIRNIRESVLKTLPINKNNTIQTATLDVRLCDLYLRSFATLENKIYLGTINATERLCGWFPKGGLIGDYDLLGGLLKNQIKEIAKELGLEHLIPTISEEAKDICSGCGYLEEFKGIPYLKLDQTLYCLETSSSEKKARKKALKKGISQTHFDRILLRVRSTKHKRTSFPEFLKVNFRND